MVQKASKVGATVGWDVQCGMIHCQTKAREVAAELEQAEGQGTPGGTACGLEFAFKVLTVENRAVGFSLR